MPRPTLSPAKRAANVQTAIDALPTLYADALVESQRHGWDSDEARAAWDAVEVAGAIVHRQGRLLAGKSKGG